MVFVGVVDLSIWGAVRDYVNKYAKGQAPKGAKKGSVAYPNAKFGNGMWVLLAGWVLLTVGVGVNVRRWRKGGGGGSEGKH